MTHFCIEIWFFGTQTHFISPWGVWKMHFSCLLYLLRLCYTSIWLYCEKSLIRWGWEWCLCCRLLQPFGRGHFRQSSPPGFGSTHKVVGLDSIEWFIRRLVLTFQKNQQQNTYHTPVSNLAWTSTSKSWLNLVLKVW